MGALPKKPFKRIYVLILAVVIILPILAYEISVFMSEEPTGPGPVAIEVVPDHASYLQGEEVHFSIYVNNIQSWRVPKPSTINYCINNTPCQTVCIDYAHPYPSFAPHSRTLFAAHAWNQKTNDAGNQTLVPPGNYTLTVSLQGPVDYGTPVNCTFEIKPNS